MKRSVLRKALPAAGRSRRATMVTATLLFVAAAAAPPGAAEQVAPQATQAPQTRVSQAAQPAMGDMPAPPPPPTRRYTLREALQEALGAPIITRRRELIEGKAQSRVDLARSEYLPTVRANARVDPLRTKDISGAADEAGGLTRDRARVSLSASLPLLDGGRRRAAVNEALAEQERDRHQMRGRVDELANRVVAVYFRLLRQHRFYDASLQKVAATRQHLRDARVRYELGAVTRLDVLTAQNALSEALADVEQYVRQIAEARAHLAQLLSADPLSQQPDAATEEPPMPALPGDVEALVARALERSPERAELLAEREAARSRLAGVQADRRPTVSAVGTIGYSYDDRDSREGGEGAYIRVSLQASLPLLRERSNRPRRQFQEQDIELQDLLIQRLEREARETVLLAYNALQRNAVAVQAARDAVREAEEALRLARGRYEVGRGTQIDVLDKLAAVTRAQNRLATTREEVAIAAYRLSILTGLEPAIAGAERGAGGPTVSAPAPVPMGSVPPGTTPSEGASPPREAPE